jgi:hypothetical protein
LAGIGSDRALTPPNTGSPLRFGDSITLIFYILNFSKKWRGREIGGGVFKMRENRKETALRAVSLSSQCVNYNGPKIAKFVLLSVIVQITIAA